MIESVETQLLGRKGLSFSIAARRSGWTPEDDTAVCWRCAGDVGPYETDGDGCASCRGRKLAWDRAVRLGHFEGIIREAILDLKFRRWRLTGVQLGEALGREITRRMEVMSVLPSEVVLVPIPITRMRRVRRGVDHTMVLARGVSRVSGASVVPLLKARGRREQIGLSATERTKNIKGAFFVPGSVISGANRSLPKGSKGGAGVRVVIVLDDVRTTGATLEEGCRVMRRALLAGMGSEDSNRGGIGSEKPEIWAVSVALAGRERKGGVGPEVTR